MTFSDYEQWKKDRCATPDNQDAAQVIAALAGRPEAAEEIKDALCDLEACSDNHYNRDTFRALFTALHNAVEEIDRRDREYTRLSAKYEDLERQVPRKCEKCGTPIIDGVNGCTFAGNVCFRCKPYKPGRAPARKPEATIDEVLFWEGKCLSMVPVPD